MKVLTRWMAAVGVSAVVSTISGCAWNGGSASSGTVAGTTSLSLTGKVFGGQQPVVGSTIQLYTVGVSGIGSASTPLIASPAVSGSGGSFSITGSYSCTSATQVYITATGGNAGAGPNGALSMMAALGSCATLQANAATTFININELSTVAAVWALAPFMTDYTHVGASGANAIGLVNAFGMANSLVNTATGALAAPSSGVSLPGLKINTLANILAACINTAGAGSSQCSTLFSATGATETIGAGLAIARSPGTTAMTSLYLLGTASPPFAPTLTTQPNDFTLAVSYSGTELQGPYGVALDASGNAWITNQAGKSVVKLPAMSSGFASTTYAVGGLAGPRGISIDRSGNIWIANTGGNDVVKLSSAGTALSGAGFTNAINSPVAIANDSAGNVWVANFNGSTITELNSSGAASGVSPMSGSGALSFPTSLAIDAAGRVAVANGGTGAVCVFSNAAVLQQCSNDGMLFGATGIAVSSAGNLAMAGSTTGATLTGAFTLGTTAGTVNAESPVTGSGLVLLMAVAYDGAGVAWFASTSSVPAFKGATAVSPAAGYGAVNQPQGIGIDGSGNVWTTNTGDNSISVFVGIATPIAVPLAMNVGP